MTAFDWDDMLILAERLSKSRGGEAARRSAISRAYLASFHAASAFVQSKGLVASSGRHLTHSQVWSALATDPNVADRRRVGNRGHQLRRDREAADYKAPFPGDLIAKMNWALAEARALVDEIDRLR